MGFITYIKNFCFVSLRIWKYKLLSNCSTVIGKPKLFHPLLLKGQGKISFGTNVQIGVVNSQFYYSHYSYLEVRNNESFIEIGNNTSINNAFSAVAFSKIIIKDNVLIGVNCSIIDNDGHVSAIENRANLIPESHPVLIENNVFIGDNVVILKGVTIGKNSVIGNGAIVTQNIPKNVVAAGNPAKVIRNL